MWFLTYCLASTPAFCLTFNVNRTVMKQAGIQTCKLTIWSLQHLTIINAVIISTKANYLIILINSTTVISTDTKDLCCIFSITILINTIIYKLVSIGMNQVFVVITIIFTR